MTEFVFLLSLYVEVPDFTYLLSQPVGLASGGEHQLRSAALYLSNGGRFSLAHYYVRQQCTTSHRVIAIQKTRPIAYRAKVLGRALLSLRTDPNRFWMLLIGNAEIAFPSMTANLPPPATAVATSNAAVFPAAINSVPDSAADVATPAGCLKREAHPY